MSLNRKPGLLGVLSYKDKKELSLKIHLTHHPWVQRKSILQTSTAFHCKGENM
jgi:hypothetical protein